MSIRIKRIYEAPEKSDGYRVLVDRLWPRGVSKAAAALDAWCKDIAPSPELRTWFGHKPDRFAEFRVRYHEELEHNTAAVTAMRSIISEHPTVTLLYAARDPEVNHARVLLEYFQQHV